MLIWWVVGTKEAFGISEMRNAVMYLKTFLISLHWQITNTEIGRDIKKLPPKQRLCPYNFKGDFCQTLKDYMILILKLF